MPWISKNAYLTASEQQNNARIFYTSMTSRGWTINAVSGILGNMEVESTINPGIWQDLQEGVARLGFGLVQWTPSTKLTDWIRDTYGSADYGNGEYQVERLLWEVEHPGPTGADQYYATSQYPLTFAEFTQSTQTPEYLAAAFLYNYERPEITPEKVKQRGGLARKWYNYLGGVTPQPLGAPVWMLFKFNDWRTMR